MTKQTIAGIIAAIAFLFLLGSAGGIEQETVSFLRGTVQMVTSLVVVVVSLKFAGAFERGEEN